jgi:DNA-binding MarR family transcriptional regulator/GNAT superfamily N-acetyltransferase
MSDAVEDVRRFNRFYTRRIGLLREHLTDSPFTLAEARVLYELADSPGTTAAGLARTLEMDKAHLSRILARLRDRGLVDERANPAHGRQRLLSPTAEGRSAFADLERRAREQAGALLSPLDEAGRARLVDAMRGIAATLGDAPAVTSQTGTPQAGTPTVVLRPPRIGDLGWVVRRQAMLYQEEYGWDWTFEGMLAGIMSGFVAGFEPERDAAWIAERDGEVVGSVFLVRGDAQQEGKLRMLYVEPSARGLGVGARLVAACIARARDVDYRALTLWTNDMLVSARRIYEAAGFRLVREEPHRSFGQDLVGQYWALDL